MRYGFYLPTRGQTATPDTLEALVLRGEALGFDSVNFRSESLTQSLDRMERFGAEIMPSSIDPR